jgi:hypothetical protein
MPAQCTLYPSGPGRECCGMSTHGRFFARRWPQTRAERAEQARTLFPLLPFSTFKLHCFFGSFLALCEGGIFPQNTTTFSSKCTTPSTDNPRRGRTTQKGHPLSKMTPRKGPHFLNLQPHPRNNKNPMKSDMCHGTVTSYPLASAAFQNQLPVVLLAPRALLHAPLSLSAAVAASCIARAAAAPANACRGGEWMAWACGVVLLPWLFVFRARYRVALVHVIL